MYMYVSYVVCTNTEIHTYLVPEAAPVRVVGVVTKAYTRLVPKIELMKAAPFLAPANTIFPPASTYWFMLRAASGMTRGIPFMISGIKMTCACARAEQCQT
jgi:hypothetical protein